MPRSIPDVGPLAEAGDPYSQVVEAAGLVFVAGQVGRPRGAPEMTFRDEARATFEKIRALLEAVGLGLDSVVRCTVYLTDFADFAVMNEVFRSFFPERPPARTTVGVAALARDCRIEVEVTAAR
ncbi:MAG TPA: RidA family protein [Candidatus Limnocylindrales bacterium]|nr:RidA family protein [Candidatus Limnocylindrales bacterium]